MAHGVRKVDEYLIKNGRAIIFTSNINSLDSNETWDSIENGSLYINPDFGTLRYKNSLSEKGVWNWFEAENIIKENTITNSLIKDRELNNSKIANAAINSRTLEDYCVTSNKIMKEALLEKHFAQKSISGRIFIDNSIDGIKIIDNSLAGSKILDRSIDKFAIKINSITGDEIKDSSIPGYKIISLDGELIEDNSISGNKIVPNTITGKNIAMNTISNLNLADGCIAANNLSSQCVKENHIGNQQITNIKYKNLSIDNNKIMDNTITGIKLANSTITGDKIANGTIGISNMSDDIKNILNNAILYENGAAKIKGNLVVNGNISATNNNCSQTITGFKVFNPVFRDFAEAFEYEGAIELGDIVEISENGKVKKAVAFSNKVVGVVSDSYAMCLGADEEEILNKSKVAVGLLGRINVNVIGKVKAGDTIVCIGDGKGKAINEDNVEPLHNCIIGRALETNNSLGNKKVLCLIQIL